jgi:hypothetical protein
MLACISLSAACGDAGDPPPSAARTVVVNVVFRAFKPTLVDCGLVLTPVGGSPAGLLPGFRLDLRDANGASVSTASLDRLHTHGKNCVGHATLELDPYPPFRLYAIGADGATEPGPRLSMTDLRAAGYQVTVAIGADLSLKRGSRRSSR